MRATPAPAPACPASQHLAARLAACRAALRAPDTELLERASAAYLTAATSTPAARMHAAFLVVANEILGDVSTPPCPHTPTPTPS